VLGYMSIFSFVQLRFPFCTIVVLILPLSHARTVRVGQRTACGCEVECSMPSTVISFYHTCSLPRFVDISFILSCLYFVILILLLLPLLSSFIQRVIITFGTIIIFRNTSRCPLLHHLTPIVNIYVRNNLIQLYMLSYRNTLLP